MAGMSRQQEFEVTGHITSTVRTHIGMGFLLPSPKRGIWKRSRRDIWEGLEVGKRREH